MSTLGSLFVPEIQILDNVGAPLNGGKLHFYAAGTITPQNTYPTSALTPGTENTNPVVLDAAGRAPIFLLQAAYKITCTDAADVELWTLDNVYPSGYVANAIVQAGLPLVCQGRLTLSSGVPITTSDVTAATTVYFTPYKGASIALYDGTNWALYAFTEKSLAIAGFAASTPFDVWGRVSSGALALDSTAWTNTTTRATALSLQDGVLVKSGDATRRYLGTFCTTGTVGQTEDSFTKRYVWNYTQRVRRALRRQETTASWTYTTNTFRQANNSPANQVEVLIGVAEVAMELEVDAVFANTNAGVAVGVSIGEDSTSTPMSVVQQGYGQSQVVNVPLAVRATARWFPAIGKHVYAWLEYSVVTGTTTWFAAGGGVASGNLGGLYGGVDG